MTREKALKLAIEQMQRRIQGLAQEANLHDRYGMESPSAKRASKERKQLNEAIKELEEMLDECQS